MESFDDLFNEEWHGLNRMFIEHDDSDQFNKQGLISSQCDIGLNFELSNIFLCASDESSNADSFIVEEEHLINVSDNINLNFYHFLSQENSISSIGATNDTTSRPYPYKGSFPFCSSNIVHSPSNDMCDTSIQYCMMDEINNSSQPTQFFSNANVYLQQDVVAEKVRMDNSLVSGRENSLKRKLETPDAGEDEVNNEKTDKNPKKRSRVSRENKNKKNVKSKKNQKMNETEDGKNNNNNGERNGQTSSSCSSNDDLNESQDANVALNPNSKTRASRGSATDPQSLYARKRRERINERLRILQNLVPNGTKVDISTMLEEAVEYVKFLKLQIQLLSSDETWMFAPIAYNGMDMGLYKNVTPTQ